MGARRFHLLHLSPRALAWAALDYQSRRWTLAASGSEPGESAEALRAWSAKQWRAGDRVRLYDARPMYFAFDFRLPKKAARQLDEILKLKIRQEIGLPPEGLLWSADRRKAEDAPNQVDLRVTVARKDSMDDLDAWREECGIDDLWVGSDSAAIRALLAPGDESAPTVVVNSAPDGMTVYRLAPGAPPARIRVEGSEGALGQAGQQWTSAARRLDFGAQAPDDSAPALAALAQLPATAGRVWLGSAPPTRRIPAPALALADLDAVLAGGAIEAATGAAAPSLLPEAAATLAAPAAELAPRLSFRWIAPFAAGSLLLLLLAHTSLARVKETSRLDLVKRANALAGETRRLKSHEAVLKRIKADRAPVMPLFVQLIKSAPQGLVVRSLSLGESGALQVAGTAQGADAPAAYSNELAKSGLFEKVDLPEIRTLGGNERRGVAFQLSARLKGRGRK